MYGCLDTFSCGCSSLGGSGKHLEGTMNPGVAQRRSFSNTCLRRTQIKRAHTHNTARALYQIAVRHFYGQVTHNNTNSTCGIITLLIRLRICQNTGWDGDFKTYFCMHRQYVREGSQRRSLRCFNHLKVEWFNRQWCLQHRSEVKAVTPPPEVPYPLVRAILASQQGPNVEGDQHFCLNQITEIILFQQFTIRNVKIFWGPSKNLHHSSDHTYGCIFFWVFILILWPFNGWTRFPTNIFTFKN